VLFVMTKDGTQHMCEYYHALNEVTVESKYSYQGLMVCLINSMVHVCSLKLIFEQDRIS
jgi:hypothetical protein